MGISLVYGRFTHLRSVHFLEDFDNHCGFAIRAERSMKFRTTFILLIVLAALGGYVLWSGRQKSDANATNGATAIPVLQLDPAGIRAVEVRGEGKQVRVERDASGWQVKVPKPGPADAFRVTEVISGLAKLSATQTITPTGQDLAPYGLDKPAYEV